MTKLKFTLYIILQQDTKTNCTTTYAVFYTTKNALVKSKE